MKLKSIRLRNFRCFEDTGEIELKPLTVLVGANSSGKSSILKFFPLLKQSINADVDGVFKWTSEDVDFYDFENTVLENNISKSITMELTFGKKDGGSFVISESIGCEDQYEETINYFCVKSEDDNAKFVIETDYKKHKLKYEGIGSIQIDEDKVEYVKGVNNFIPNVFYKTKFLSLVKSRVDNLINTTKDEFDNFIKNIYYMAPLRLDVLRNYSIQHQGKTDYVYSNASNLAYYLNQLSNSDKIELNKWFEEYGFDISIDFEKLSKNINAGILEICIKTKWMKKSRNIIDLGFGFSQILPIIVLMWDSIKKVTETGYRDNQYSKIVVIEQPEVHLHPRYIGKFATIISKAIKLCEEKQIPISFIVETHSFSLLNKIGTLVYGKNMKKEDVNVLIFNQDEEQGITIIEPKTYDEEGALEDWPINFFDED